MGTFKKFKVNSVSARKLVLSSLLPSSWGLRPEWVRKLQQSKHDEMKQTNLYLYRLFHPRWGQNWPHSYSMNRFITDSDHACAQMIMNEGHNLNTHIYHYFFFCVFNILFFNKPPKCPE